MTEQEDIKTLQAEGKGPAPCARFCEATAFKIEIAGWKRDQAENLANQCKLVDQVNALTAERDAYAKCADDMAASHKVERDELSRLYENTLKREYALHEAAKLALDALSLMANEINVALLLGVDSPFEQDTTLTARKAIAALKAVL